MVRLALGGWWAHMTSAGISDLRTREAGSPAHSSHNNNHAAESAVDSEHKNDKNLDGFHFRRYDTDWQERGVLLGRSGAG